jgi:hypothetical protein
MDGEAWGTLPAGRSTGFAGGVCSAGACTVLTGFSASVLAGSDALGGAFVSSGTDSTSATSARAIKSPVFSLSPSFTLISRITPAKGEGISITAFSLSMASRASSASTSWPRVMNISATGTESSVPRSGILISFNSAIVLPYTVIGLGLLLSRSYFLMAWLSTSVFRFP